MVWVSPFAVATGLVLLVTVFVYFSVEQSLIAGNLAASRQALAQNNVGITAGKGLRAVPPTACTPGLGTVKRTGELTACTVVGYCQSQAIRASNEELEEAKAELQDEEDE